MARASEYRLLRPRLTFRTWQYGTTGQTVIDGTGAQAHLETTARDIKVGDLVFFEPTGRLLFGVDTELTFGGVIGGGPIGHLNPPAPSLARVTATAVTLWYANGLNGDPTKPPDANAKPQNPAAGNPVPVVPSNLSFAPALGGALCDLYSANVLVHAGWPSVGALSPRRDTSTTRRPRPSPRAGR